LIKSKKILQLEKEIEKENVKLQNIVKKEI